MADQKLLFVLDANTFIESKNRYYRFTVCPGFWASLIRLHDDGKLCSIDRVKEELVAGEDALATWITDQLADDFFRATSEVEVQHEYSQMIQWVVENEQFKDSAKAEFGRVADGWLVALARSMNLTVVTHEKAAPEARKKVPIPSLCEEFGVAYIDIFEMLETLQVSFS